MSKKTYICKAYVGVIVEAEDEFEAEQLAGLEMDIGDSVFFAEEQVNGKAYRAAMSVGRRQHRKYVARREDEGLRIWRSE